MKKIFQDLISMDGVYGLVLLSKEGKVLFESLDKQRFVAEKSSITWDMIVGSLGEFEEMDLLFENGRYYLRHCNSSYLLISLSLNASMAMIKLNCDVAASSLEKIMTGGKGLKRFFRF